MIMCGDHEQRPETLVSSFGMHVEGPHFWPRPTVVCELVEGLSGGKSFTMFGLRRIGKSSVMAETRRQLADRKITVIHIDAQNFQGLAGLFSAILRGLPEQGLRDKIADKLCEGLMITGRLIEPIRGILKGKGPDLGADHETDLLEFWSVIAPAVGQRLAESKLPIVLCIDELPMLFQSIVDRPRGVDVADSLLRGLRQWRTYPSVSMFLTGSIGMRGLAKAKGLDGTLLNDLIELALPPLPRSDASLMLRALIAGAEQQAKWKDSSIEATLNRMQEYHPSVIQFAFHYLRSRDVSTLEAIGAVFDKEIDTGIQTNFYQQFTQRLQDYDTHLRKQLHAVLGIAAANAEPTHIDDADWSGDDLEDLILILQQDGFIDWNGRAQTFALADRLVQGWWANRPRRGR
jgi:hypothetical protein